MECAVRQGKNMDAYSWCDERRQPGFQGGFCLDCVAVQEKRLRWL